MKIEEIHQILVEKFGSQRIVGLVTEGIDPWIEVAAASVVEVGTFLRDDPRLAFDALNNLTAVDYLEPDKKKAASFGHEPHLEVVYHLYSYGRKHFLTMKVKLPRWKGGVEGELPEMPSAAGVWAIADWHEREAYDLMGIQFQGHPGLVRILCPDDWVGHPLRKDYAFPEEYQGIRGK